MTFVYNQERETLVFLWIKDTFKNSKLTIKIDAAPIVT